MEVVVTWTAEGWTALRGRSVVGAAAALVRPDGRCFVAFRSCGAEAYGPLLDAIGRHARRDLHTEVDQVDATLRDRLVGLGARPTGGFVDLVLPRPADG